MKLRRLPEDFQVEEQASVDGDSGPFALYELRKQSIGTPEAVAAIVDRWQTIRNRISYGGLKDKHAVTSQYLSIYHGPQQDLQQDSFELTYIGQMPQAFTSANILANRFTLVLRDMDQAQIDHALKAMADLQQTGLPNYFDDQRFGSLGFSNEWIGKAWCLGDYERALWLALADPHLHDSSFEKQQKQILHDLWGDWPACKQELSRSHRRSVITYLSDKVLAGKPADIRGAFSRLSVDLRGLYLSAWQSALWNRLLTRLIQRLQQQSGQQQSETPTWQLVPFELKSGPAVFVSEPSATEASQQALRHLQSVELTLPSARIDRPDGLIGELLDEVLAEEQIQLSQLKVKHPRDCFFSRSARRAMIQPADLTTTVDADALYSGRLCLTLSFLLPRGSYATIVVKRLTEDAFDDG